MKSLVIGIPSIPREGAYVRDTVRSVIAGMRGHEGTSTELVMLNAAQPGTTHTELLHVAEEYRTLVDAKRLTIFANSQGHGRLQPVIGNANDPHARYAAWMATQNLDAALLMEFCATRGEYYLHLEDDIIAADEWLAQLERWKAQHFDDRADWAMLCLYSPLVAPDRTQYDLGLFTGAIGLFLRSRDLPPLVAYLRRRCKDAPLDWLIRDFLRETNGKAFLRTPSLFQHVGVVSTNLERVRLDGAPSFDEPWARRNRRRVAAVLAGFRRWVRSLVAS